MLRLVVALCLLGLVVCGSPVSRSRAEIQKFRDYLESTRTDRGFRFGSRPQGHIWEDSGKYQGDILLDEEQVEAMVQQFSAGRNAYTWPNTKWPNRVVVYEFAAGEFTEAQRQYMLDMMTFIEQYTCITFRQRVLEFNYVRLTTRHEGCYAHVGYWPFRGVHELNLESYPPGLGCFNGVVVVHEWLHIIGFFHMQSTHDRDDYVRINWDNIESGLEYAFERYGPDLVDNLGLPYEYDSCMHYGPYAFSKNGRTTIDALRPHHGTMGQYDYITAYDFWRVDRHYGCAAWKTAKDYKPLYFNGTEKDVYENLVENNLNEN